MILFKVLLVYSVWCMHLNMILLPYWIIRPSWSMQKTIEETKLWNLTTQYVSIVNDLKFKLVFTIVILQYGIRELINNMIKMPWLRRRFRVQILPVKYFPKRTDIFVNQIYFVVIKIFRVMNVSVVNYVQIDIEIWLMMNVKEYLEK